MNISQVETKKELNSFIDLPYRYYKNDPVWVPPLRDEQKGQFDHRRNPLLDHCEYDLFLLWDEGKLIGRVAAFIDKLAVEAWKEPIGLFGYYECRDNREASKLLLDSARDWLYKHEMKVMRGPWSFVSQEWGAVVEGYTPEPVVMAPYNPPFYNDQFSNYGLVKIKDLMVYEIDARQGYRIPERILTLTDQVD